MKHKWLARGDEARRTMRLAGHFAVWLCCLCCSLSWAALPPAGVEIHAVAYAEFDDEQGLRQVRESNVVWFRVSGVSSFSLESAQTQPGLPGSTRYFSHVLSNTGNVAAVFDLALAAQAAGFAPQNPQLFQDANCDGRPEGAAWLAGELAAQPSWTAGQFQTSPLLQPGEGLCLVAALTVPALAQVGQQASLQLHARGNTAHAQDQQYLGAAEAFNRDLVTASQGPDILLNKSLSLTEGRSPEAGIEVVLRYQNRGLGEAQNLHLVDVLGFNSSQLPFSSLLGAGADNHAYDTRGLAYMPNSASWAGRPLSDQEDGDEGGIFFRYDSGTRQVHAVLPRLPAGQAGELRFRVNVLANLPEGTAAQTSNRAAFRFDDGASRQFGTSNLVPYRVTSSSAPTAPRLALSLQGPAQLMLGERGVYRVQVSNTGSLATGDNITVQHRLPPGMQYEAQVQGQAYWGCAAQGDVAQGQLLTCVSNGSIAAGGQAPLIGLRALPQAAHYPQLPLVQPHQACVAGGSDATIGRPSNRCAQADTEILAAVQDASLAGRIWLDVDQDREFNQGQDQALAGWQARLCPYDPAEDSQPPSLSHDPVLGWVQQRPASGASTQACGADSLRLASGSDGSFRFAQLPAGRYKLQFHDSGGRLLLGRAHNGSASLGQRAYLHWSHSYLIVDLQPGENALEQNLPLDPSGIVFDATTRLPVAGARVRLSGPAGFDPAQHHLGGTAALEQTTQVTGGAADGFYQFLLVGGYPAGEYRLSVSAPGYLPVPAAAFPAQSGALRPPLSPCVMTGGACSVDPAGSASIPPASRAPFYFLRFNLGQGGDRTDVINNHIPLLPLAASSGLLISKTADREQVELGEFVNYTVELANRGSVTQPGLRLTDTLPRGFGYVRGTARLGGVALEPAINPDGSLTWLLPDDLPGNSTFKLTYRLSVGANALLGDGINRVQAFSDFAQSNVGMAPVKVLAGVFSDKAYVLGKVFADCNGDGLKQAGELGVPGVRLILNDGSFVITDVYGDYSFYGLSPRLSVLKVDPSTVPAGLSFPALSNRNAGRGDSRFVDLKKGELHRADFPAAGCSETVAAELQQRIKAALNPLADAEQLLNRKLEARAQLNTTTDSRSLPATGLLGGQGSYQPSVLPKLDSAVSGLAQGLSEQSRVQHALSPVALEGLLPHIVGNAPGFLQPLNGDVLPMAQTAVRVKGVLGSELRLLRNGEPVSLLLVGKRSSLPSERLAAWEYIGVDLKPGPNTLTLEAVDPFGNVRARESITVTAPGALAKLAIAPVGATESAGRPVQVKVSLQDAAGVPVAVRTPLTLEAKTGTWLTPDLDPKTPGIQVFLEGGEAVYSLKSPLSPQEEALRVSSGLLEAATSFNYLPVLRPLVASGLVEGTLAFRQLSPNGVRGLKERDGFEQEIENFSTCGSDYNCIGIRSSLYLKGHVRGDYLLTLSYDSDKNLDEREFRDIQPDEFYPVYGDASVKGFDAQSTQRLYVRLDKGPHYALYGDFNTGSQNEGRKLSQYNRNLTGLKLHQESRRAQASVFASYDNLTQIIEELPANGTSGPYRLSSNKGLINSEQVEILVRDRNQPDLILETRPQSRFSDYEIERDTGRIYFKSPVASVDANFNPQSIRVTYEVDEGGDKFLVSGVEGQVKLTDKVEVGGVLVRDDNPADGFALYGLNSTVRLGEKTMLVAELAQTEKDSVGDGQGQRLEVSHKDQKLEARAFVARTDLGFDNPSAILNQGRSEAGLKASYQLPQSASLQVEALRTEDEKTGAYRDGQMVAVSKRLNDLLTGEVGLRSSRDVIVDGSSANSAGASAQPGTDAGNDLVSARVKLSTLVPEFPNTSAYLEYEQDVDDHNARNVALGGEWRFRDRGRAYLRHNLVSAISSPWALSQTTRNHTTLAGIEGDYMEGGQAFSEYRVDSGLDDEAAEAAFGLRNTFAVRPGLRLGTSFENTQRLRGTGEGSMALTAALEYTADPDWKGSTRYEFRTADSQISTLYQLGGARRLDEQWTALGRYSFQRTGSRPEAGDRSVEYSQRIQLGAAFRDRDSNRLSALGKYEFRQEELDGGEPYQRDVDIFSLHANYQPSLPLILSGRLAGKWVDEDSLGLASEHGALLVSGRLTRDLNKTWDVGLIGSTLVSGENPGSSARQREQWGLGAELGYQVQESVWLAVGYNFMGFEDRDFREMEYTDRGLFIRVRFKFDERSFGWLAPEVGGKTP